MTLTTWAILWYWMYRRKRPRKKKRLRKAVGAKTQKIIDAMTEVVKKTKPKFV